MLQGPAKQAPLRALRGTGARRGADADPAPTNRGGRIRTGDFSLPKRARYQAAPRPDPVIVLGVAAADGLGGSGRASREAHRDPLARSRLVRPRQPGRL